MIERGALPGFQKPKVTKFKEVRLAVISQGNDGQSVCSCGWSYRHHRTKVREDAIDQHINSHHQGRGIRV